MNRISVLREKALNKNICYDEFFYKYFKTFDESKGTLEECHAEAFFKALSELTPIISDGELIVGKCGNVFSQKEKKEWDEVYYPIANDFWEDVMVGQDSHMSVDYELLLEQGISGIIKRIEAYLSECSEEKQPFYLACKKSLEAIVKHSLNYSEEAERQAETETNELRKAELLKIAEACRNVPLNPPKNFYEALQSVHFLTYCLSMDPFRRYHQQFQLGHPDRYLMPYYENDIKNGVITKEYAQLLLDCLGIMINERVTNGLSSGYMVGGRDKDNNITENELTYMLMDVIKNVRLVYPAVGLCYTKGMSDRVLERACEIISLGCSHPAIFNDDIIVKGLKYYGVPECEVHNYIHSTCVEITPVASSNVWVASPYTNMAQLLLDCMDREYDSFDELLKTYFSKLDASVKANFEQQTEFRKMRAEKTVNPLLSCFVNDCLEKGTDILRGGARYNWTMPSFVGVANLVDSLYALKSVVFEKKEFTIAELKKITEENFEGNEALRLRLLNTLPKYGNDIDEVDEYFGVITEHIVNECKKYTGVFDNANLIPSVFCWEMHEKFGSQTLATPDGRIAYFPLGDGSGPCQGREFNGPTASILSSVKWEHTKFIGGVAVNIKFSKKSLGNDSINNMKNLVKTYLKKGGFEIQINVVDKEVLEKALDNPEEYKDLVVRIGGYSDYFVKLSRNMQREVILRTEHNI